MPFNHSQTRPRQNYPINLFNLPNRISLDEKVAPLPYHKGAEEIPVFHYDHATMSDPILFAEAMKEQGSRFGAVKIIMPENFNNMARTNFQVNPDLFQFKTNRISTNPNENEIMTRLRFYNELIKFHIEAYQKSESQSSPVKMETEPAAENGASEPAAPKEPKETKEESSKQPLPRPRVPAFLHKLPMMDKRPLDLFDLFRLVVMRGGYNEVINRKLWAQIGRELGYKGKITSSLSSSLKLSYAKILHPLEEHLGSRCGYIAGLAEASNTLDEEPAAKKPRLESHPPLLLGSAREFRRSVRAKSSKGILLNKPHLIDLKPPLVFSTSSNQNTENSGKTPKSTTTCSLTPAAQINSYLKFLSSNSANLQDASRHEPNGRSSSVYTLRQFIEKDCKFQEVLISSNPTLFGKNSERPIASPPQSVGQQNGFQVNEESGDVTPQALEEVFWQRVCREGVDDVLDGLKIENGFSLLHLANSSGFLRVGDDFFNYKSQLNANSQPNQSLPSSGSDGSPKSQELISTASSQSGTPTPVDTPIISARNSFTGSTETSMTSTSHNEALILNCQPYISRTIGNSLAPFNLHNIPTLPNSLLGAYLAHDINNNDISNSQLNVGMTFSTENWHCEDHFLQRCSYHFFGRSKRWYYIPESEFAKFEDLLKEVNYKNSGAKVNLNSNLDCWQIPELMRYLNTDDSTLSFEYDCLLISLENMISPYPEIRAFINDPEFQKLIEFQRSKRGGILHNQEYFITPEMLRERNIRFTTTLQRPGELILQYPKTYSASISLGLNIGEEVNFASKSWLDYAIEGENWLKDQGLLPNISVFKLLVNIANLYENNCGSFDADVYNKTSECYDKLLESELDRRMKVRSIVKMKEIVIEERSAHDADDIADDDLQNVYPSKVVITNAKDSELFSLSLDNFIEYAQALESQAQNENGQWQLPDFINLSTYRIELHVFLSDDRLKNYQKTLRGYSVEFDDWVANYEELMRESEDISLKAYKSLLSDGQKILSALSSAHPRFKRFVSNGMRIQEDTERELRMSQFKSYVENLDNFVTHCNEVIEECQAVLSLKHQQRIRGAPENASPPEQDKQGKLSTLLDLATKIPNFNFYAPEFDQILEFKNEIQNFDRACRNLISKANVQQSELNDMINLGTSFGIQLPVLDFLIRLRDREVWLKTYDTLYEGGDPFAGKKEVYSLSHLQELRDNGLRVLATEDLTKLQQVDLYLRDGHAYDEKVKDYMKAHRRLESVDLNELHSLIVDMEDRAKERGKKRLFVYMESYQELVDLKAQAPLIEFLQSYRTNSPNLFTTKQMMADLRKSKYDFDDSEINADYEKSLKWVESLWSAIKKVKTSFGSRSKRSFDTQSLKVAVNTELAKKITTIYNKLATNLSDNETDPFERSGGYVYLKDIEPAYDERHPLRYCLCREFEDGIMIECDRCHEWYHIFCVKEKLEIEETEENYVCPACVLLDSNSMMSEFANEKVSDTVIDEFVASGKSLNIQPTSELGELKKLKDLIDGFKKEFSADGFTSEQNALLVHKAAFVFRKVFGAPVIMTSIYEVLLDFLKSNSNWLNVPKPQIPPVKPVEEAAHPMDNQQSLNDVPKSPGHENELPKKNKVPREAEIPKKHEVSEAAPVQTQQVQSEVANTQTPSNTNELVSATPAAEARNSDDDHVESDPTLDQPVSAAMEEKHIGITLPLQSGEGETDKGVYIRAPTFQMPPSATQQVNTSLTEKRGDLSSKAVSEPRVTDASELLTSVPVTAQNNYIPPQVASTEVQESKNQSPQVEAVPRLKQGESTPEAEEVSITSGDSSVSKVVKDDLSSENKGDDHIANSQMKTDTKIVTDPSPEPKAASAQTQLSDIAFDNAPASQEEVNDEQKTGAPQAPDASPAEEIDMAKVPSPVLSAPVKALEVAKEISRESSTISRPTEEDDALKEGSPAVSANFATPVNSITAEEAEPENTASNSLEVPEPLQTAETSKAPSEDNPANETTSVPAPTPPIQDTTPKVDNLDSQIEKTIQPSVPIFSPPPKPEEQALPPESSTQAPVSTKVSPEPVSEPFTEPVTHQLPAKAPGHKVEPEVAVKPSETHASRSIARSEPGDDTLLASLAADFPNASAYPDMTYVDQTLSFAPSLSEQNREKTPQSTNLSSDALGEMLLAELEEPEKPKSPQNGEQS